jgi:uncharacterized protein (TIGR03437 family)
VYRALWILLLGGCGAIQAQVSLSAYRVLGQTNCRFAGLNQVQGVELYGPASLALDSRNGQLHIYIADTGNSRVLAWADVNAYQIGDPPALVLGQPGPQYSNLLGIGVKGFAGLTAMAVDPTTGNLYVADTTNNRVLRFLSPFANPNRAEPDAVYGQSSFQTRIAAATSNGLNQPLGVAFDSSGNLWIADTGNHRVLRYPSSVLNSLQPAADLAIGQKDLASGSANAGGQVSAAALNAPTGLAFDAQNNLYVADYGNTRVLRFAAPLATNMPATAVWGETNFTAHGVPATATAASLAGPMGISVDNNGSLYVAVPRDNRVMVFPVATATGATATSVLGQTDFSTSKANTGSAPLASPGSLALPADVKLDSSGNVFVVDGGNNRVLQFPANSKSATRLWGQADFLSNGPNQIKAGSINYPYKIAIDYSSAPYALYVSDTGNNRVLVWKDSVRFRSGDPADMAIGQPNLQTASANVDSQGSPNPTQTGLFGPEGLVVNPGDGTLYVADRGNHRVLRYPRPVAQSGRIVPDAVIGQLDFNSSSTALVNATSLNSPGGLAIGPNGDVFVADSGNNRVLEYAAGAGNGAAAIRVYGQPNMTSSGRPTQLSAQTLASPQGIAVDTGSNLYVADAGANRVLIFPNTPNAPIAGLPATFVVGASDFGRVGNLFKVPMDVAIDSAGSVYVSDQGNNRVLIFPSLLLLPVSGGTASGFVGQSGVTGTAANWDSSDGLATAEGLYAPSGIYVDRQDTLYVGDAGNNRVLHFLRSGSTVNAATFQASAPLGQGALVTFFGNALAGDSAVASGAPWPVALVNRQVVINDDLVAPLYYAGPGQVNFQMPSSAPLGSDRVAVRLADTGELLAGGNVLVAATSPGIFTAAQTGSGQAAAVNQDGTLNGASHPAPAGSTILLYGTGPGQVSPAVPDGSAAPFSPLAQTVAVPTSSGTTCLNNQPSMCVAIGSSFANVSYSGLAPGNVGLWQINVTIPQGTPAGSAVPVRVVINGVPSNTVTVAVR